MTENDMPENKPKLDPYDVDQFRTPNAFDGSGDGIRKELTHVRVGKPRKSSFFKSSPDPAYRLQISIIEDDSGMTKQDYLVVESIAKDLIEETKPKLLVLCVDRMGIPFLWLAPRVGQNEQQRPNLWNTTALKALASSETNWVRMASNMAEGCYTIHVSNSSDDPIWPDLSMGELIKLGFGEEYIIRSTKHPLVQRLWGHV